jgi:hypothetical protein
MADQLVLVDTDVFIWLSRGKSEAAPYAPLVAKKRIVLRLNGRSLTAVNGRRC